jgi:hypothetical protein
LRDEKIVHHRGTESTEEYQKQNGMPRNQGESKKDDSMRHDSSNERDPLTESVIGAAIEVHRVLGPGLLESVYETCLCYELEQLGIEYRRQDPLPIT